MHVYSNALRKMSESFWVLWRECPRLKFATAYKMLIKFDDLRNIATLKLWPTGLPIFL